MSTATQPRERHTLTVQVDAALRRRIEERAKREDRSLGQIVRHAALAYLADERSEQAA